MAFKKIKTGDYDLQKVQDNVELEFLSVEQGPFIKGLLKKSISLLITVDNVVNHGLNRAYVGFVVTNKNAAADVWVSSTTNNITKNQIILKAGANVTADIWFF